MTKQTIYYHQEHWGEVSFQDGEFMRSFSNIYELEAFLFEKYDSNYELSLVTEDNWHSLYDAGAFDNG